MKKKLNRREILKLGTLALGGLGLSSSNLLIKKEPSRERLNFIFILTDDQRYDALSIANHPFLKTPTIDWIAKQGARFENAFVTTSLCSPSRASFLTGKYAHKHGVINNLTPWNDENITFLELLKKNGYHTGFIGKWHMPGRGLPDLYGKGKVDKFISFTAYGGQGLYFDCPMYLNGKKIKTSGYITDVLNDYAIQFIREAKAKNFCLYLSHKAAHSFFESPAPFKGMYENEKLELPDEFKENGLNTKFSALHLIKTKDIEKLYKNYCETIKALDSSLARVFEELETLKLLESTVIIFSSDNGFFWGEHRLIDKRFAYEEAIKIPLLIKAPGIIAEPETKINDIVLNIDIAPTILELAEIEIPEYMQGMSFKPLLKKQANSWRENFLYEYFYDPPYPVPDIVALRTKDKKYIRYADNKLKEEFFNLRDDPKEKKNLLDLKEFCEQKRELLTALENLLKTTGYPLEIARKKFGLSGF